MSHVSDIIHTFDADFYTTSAFTRSHFQHTSADKSKISQVQNGHSRENRLDYTHSSLVQQKVTENESHIDYFLQHHFLYNLNIFVEKLLFKIKSINYTDTGCITKL